MKIIGIDPGYDRLGWAVGENTKGKWNIADFGCIQTAKSDTLVQRYSQINTELSEIISEHKPDQAAVETLFFSVNKKTALQVSEARGVILSCLIQNNIEIFEYNPNQIKLTVTGYGNADKKAVEKMVRLQLPIPKIKIIDDAIDALAIMMTHYHLKPFS